MNKYPDSVDDSADTTSERVSGLMRLLETTCQLAALWDVDQILRLVTEGALSALNCERATLFLHDEDSQELFTRVVTQLELQEIRMPVNQGVSGWVARHRLPANIPDPRQDSRWNSTIDQQTGFQTRNILAVPVISAHDGRLCGVLQLLNKRNGSFETFDELVLQAFAAHAAYALERSQLWKQARTAQELQLSLEMGRRIQQTFLPDQLPQLPAYEFASWWEPADAVGGDYFDLLSSDNGNILGVIADVSGHGVAASLIMASVRAMWHVLAKTGAAPDQTVNWVADAISDDLREGRFITLLMLELDVHRHEIRYANAGHAPALLFKAETKEVIPLKSTGLPLGFSRDLQCRAGESHRLAPSDLVILATDGLIESRNKEGEYFGTERLASTIRHLHGCSARQIVDGIRKALADFVGERAADDDITLLVIRRSA